MPTMSPTSVYRGDPAMSVATTFTDVVDSPVVLTADLLDRRRSRSEMSEPIFSPGEEAAAAAAETTTSMTTPGVESEAEYAAAADYASANDSVDGRPSSRCAVSRLYTNQKTLAFGQVLSLLLAASGAIQSTLYLECRLSAPAFSVFLFYLPMSAACLINLRRDETLRRRRSEAAGGKGHDEECEFRRVKSRSDGGDDDDVRGRSDDDGNGTGREEGRRKSPMPSPSPLTPPLQLELEDRSVATERNRTGSGRDGVEPDIRAPAGGDDDENTRKHSLFGLASLRSSPRWYALCALADFYANYVTVKALRYTTVTSVSLFDALAIPSAVLVSRIFLGRRYTRIHLLGMVVCSVGIAANSYQDYLEDQELEDGTADGGGGEDEAQKEIAKDYPHKMRGDLLAIAGGLLYGISNTLAEVAVREWGTRTEYLGAMSFFASIIAGVQALAFEREGVAAFFGVSDRSDCPGWRGPILLLGFVAVSWLNYSGISAFLQISDSAFLNMSLLTGDLWAVLFSVAVEGIVPPVAFYVALVFTLSGVIVYETAPSPVVVVGGDGQGGGGRVDGNDGATGGGGGPHGVSPSPSEGDSAGLILV